MDQDELFNVHTENSTLENVYAASAGYPGLKNGSQDVSINSTADAFFGPRDKVSVSDWSPSASNHRTDQWGGFLDNRVRFAAEVAKAIAKKIGPHKVGFRMSPFGVFNGMQSDPHTEDLFELLAGELQKIGILYVHVVDHSCMGAPEVKPSVKRKIRDSFKNIVILSGGYDAKQAEHDLSEKKGDLFAFGRPFISNPHLVSKLKNKKPLLAADQKSFYTADEKGYTDYPLD